MYAHIFYGAFTIIITGFVFCWSDSVCKDDCDCFGEPYKEQGSNSLNGCMQI